MSCNAVHPRNPEWRCNRFAGHPGEHCRDKLSVIGYENIWWPQTMGEEASGSGLPPERARGSAEGLPFDSAARHVGKAGASNPSNSPLCLK